MAITAHVNAYSNFGMLGTDSWYRKLVHQFFRVKFISKKKKPALCFFLFSAFFVIQKSRRKDAEHLQVASTLGKMPLLLPPAFFSFFFFI